MARPVVNLYLIEGEVRLQPLQAGASSVQSKQTRLVWAKNLKEAVDKYEAYFASMNNASEAYIVLNTSTTEALK